MASMAGALRVRLEKIGHYSLGDEIEPATLEKCSKALSIMKLTVILFSLLFSAPAILILYFAGWWQLLYLGWH
jgi:adenosylcobinamide-phosphate synthase